MWIRSLVLWVAISGVGYVLADNSDPTDLPEEVEAGHTGAYQVNYSGKSQSISWEEKSEGDQTRLTEGEFFNGARSPLFVRDLPDVFLFHNPDKNQLRVAGGGADTIRKCKFLKDKSEDDQSIFECTFFKAKEEEQGTGCTIEHWFQDEVTLQDGESPLYVRTEKRTLIESEDSHCDDYKKKIADELSENRSELFFRTVFETGGIDSLEQLGNTFVLKHFYRLKLQTDH